MHKTLCTIVTAHRFVHIFRTRAHIIGNIGPIYAEEWDALKDKGYSYNDKVGKSGIEKYSETY